MGMIEFFKKLSNRFGFDICRYHPTVHSVARRLSLMKHHEIDIVFDVGANAGQFAEEIRKGGWKGNIISFEPLKEAYSILNGKLNSDPFWKGFNIALGDKDGTAEINVANNSYSSSILEMLPAHIQSAPESKYITMENIVIRRLDSIIGDLYQGQSLYLKIDTQGFEDKVLDGARGSLGKIIGIQLEMSLIPIYREQSLYVDMCKRLLDYGFILMSIEPGFADPVTGQLLQVDGIFYKV